MAAAGRRVGARRLEVAERDARFFPVDLVLVSEADPAAREGVLTVRVPLASEPGAADALLASLVTALQEAQGRGAERVAVASLATARGWLVERSAPALLAASVAFLESHATSLNRIVFCLPSRSEYDVFKAALDRTFPVRSGTKRRG